MYSVTRSFGLNGLSGFAVAVEADISGGLPAFSIVGLPDSAVRESADRVRAAIKNLASSSRTGALPSILPRRMCARPARCTTCRFCWQCSLPAASWRMCLPTRHFWANWHWTAPCGRFPACCPWRWLQQKIGIHALYVPAENAAEAAEACADSMAVYPAHTAREVVDALRGIYRLPRRLLFPLTLQTHGHRCRIFRT